uniref:Uncharacterized protein n=1 Tax=Utricularia reniformis TaxID=192314 RepID=A0A1Y0B261_9LAMI|nr:hypothetical protein AEK19_MT1272 [Utricularia reniformis]ART31478.1 hypothetical protein AEK19_MT1272 [Utricularia reniformis]
MTLSSYLTEPQKKEKKKGHTQRDRDVNLGTILNKLKGQCNSAFTTSIL